MGSETTRTGHGTEQIERGSGSRRERERAETDSIEEVVTAAFATRDRRAVGLEEGISEQRAGNLSRMVRTLLTALRFYAENGIDAGETARKALRLHKGTKYAVS